MLRLSLIIIAVLLTPHGMAVADDLDFPPRGIDLDLVGAAREGPTRVRWFFSPSSPGEAETAVTEQRGGVERIAILSLFDDRWILEAPADSLVRVEAEFGPLGILSRDESGEPALLEATALIGVDAAFVADADLRGDVASTVAFLDSGCDTAHDDLGDPDENDIDGYPEAGDVGDWLDASDLLSGELEVRIVGWHDVTDDLPLAVGPWDDHLHGTAMASAGFGNGRIDQTMKGVAPEGRMVIVKTWNFEGRWERWASDFFLGVEWLILNADRLRVQAAVVGTVWDEDQGFGPAVDALAEAGILLIAPVGNDRAAAGWPARVPEAFGVGAATKSAKVAAYSARASSLTSPPVLDVVAPGGSTLEPGGAVVVADNEPNDSYRGRTGTSIAAGMVAGAVSVVAEIARESGYAWPTGRDRVQWLTDLLSYTSVELAVAESGAPGSPVLDRGGADQYEGHGLIQVEAATQAINNIMWPGDRADFFLDHPVQGDAVWAARLPGGANVPITLSLTPSSGIDADLFVFEDTGSQLTFLGSGTRAGSGAVESVELERAPMNDLIVVARRVTGAGSVIFTSLQRFGASSLWPRELRSRQTTQPVAADLDGDGVKELVLTNTFSVDKRVHEFVVYDARGRTFGFFPRSVDSTPNPGSLTSPVVGVVGSRLVIAAGSDFGFAYAVSDSAQLLFSTGLTQGWAITAPVIWEEGASGRLLFGSQTGIQVLTGAGIVERVISLGSPVSGECAVGDLDGDGLEEIVAVTDDGLVHAVEIDGTPLPGWPLSIGATPGSPVLVGATGAAGVEYVVLPETTASGELRLHALAPDAQPHGSSPWTLDRDGLPLLASSAIAAARNQDSTTEVVIGAALGNYNGEQVYRIWRLHLETGTIDMQQLVYSDQHLLLMLHFSRGLILDEPRLADLSSAPGLEVLQTTQFDWSETFVGNPRRYGSSRQYYEWRSSGPPLREALGAGHERFPDVWGMSPMLTDFESDGYPDFIIVREDRVYRTGSRMRWTLDGMWGAERGGRTRSACLDCEGPRFVATAQSPRALSVSASPNPFNPRTVLRAQLPSAGYVEWSVYDARGRRVHKWGEFVGTAGEHRTRFDGTDQRGARLSSGVYFVQVRHATGTARTRIVLVR